MTDVLRGMLADLCGVDPAGVLPGTRLSELDLDSLTLVELSERIRTDVGVEIHDDELASLDRVSAIGEVLRERAGHLGGGTAA